MKPKIRLKLYQDKEGDSRTHHYHIGMEINHERFEICFMGPEKFTLPEANARIIYLATGMDAETDGIKIANQPLDSDAKEPAQVS